MTLRDKKGKIEVVIGPMYSGKTEELIRRVVRRTIARQRGVIFKISSDTRTKEEKVISRAGTSLEAKVVDVASDALKYVDEGFDYVAFDEVQFFDDKIVDVVKEFVNHGTDVIVAGLNLDFRGEPFESVMKIAAISDEIALLKAVCVVCGEDATRTQRLILKNGKWMPASKSDPVFKVEGEDIQIKYEPRCKDCWEVEE
ncbi:thymidine kinase [Mesoaciditoga lauensis]|uniref:thymidine kinase n=1 Tax=Mesoaciditoga lauensis TaxID=1495039 RepID=UPI00055F8577